jgi:prepilin-type N-terminal cleavage/methylation domain-containing protein
MSSLNKKQKGFTLVEILIAMILMSIGIIGLVVANGTLSKVNGAGIELSTAEFLLEQVRERSALMSFSSIESLDGKTYCPPEDATGIPLPDFVDYTQQITVEHVLETDLEQVDSTNSSPFKRITVEILHSGRIVTSGQWIRGDI